MRKNPELQDWIRTVIKKMPNLSKRQAIVLAMWSFGMVMSQSCGLTTVSTFLAQLLGKKENTVRQQLREWYRDSKDKNMLCVPGLSAYSKKLNGAVLAGITRKLLTPSVPRGIG